MGKLFAKRENFFRDVWMFIRMCIPFLNFFCLFITGQYSRFFYQRIFIVLLTVYIMNFFVSPIWFCVAGGVAYEIAMYVQSRSLPKKKRKYYETGHYAFCGILTICLSAILGSVIFDEPTVSYNRFLLFQTGVSAPGMMKAVVDSVPLLSSFRR